MDSHNINWTVKTEEGQIGQSNGVGQSKLKKDRLDSQTELDSQNRRRKNGTVKSTYWTVAWGII
ncbi:MAG TPA: hypothetical protein DCL26_06960 [Alteromonas australica]|nr:hypothetical protein [Alteromonas australica]